MLLVSGLALRTGLVPVLSLVLIAWPANRKCADITCNKLLSINGLSNSVTTDLAHLTTQIFHGLSLHDNELKI